MPPISASISSVRDKKTIIHKLKTVACIDKRRQKKVYRYPFRTEALPSLAERFPFILFLSAMFKPKFFTVLPELTAPQIGRDVVAGILVGIVALPLAIAFAIASGVSPEKG